MPEFPIRPKSLPLFTFWPFTTFTTFTTGADMTTKRRVIFVPDDYWTNPPKERTVPNHDAGDQRRATALAVWYGRHDLDGINSVLQEAVDEDRAAELIVARADPSQPNMALTTWSGSRVRKQDILIAKNYLSADEVDTLNRLVVIFLEQAELRAKQHKNLTLDFWRSSVE